MKKTLFLVVIAMILNALPVFSQLNRTIEDEEHGTILYGFCTREGLMSDGDWFKTEYETYTIKTEIFDFSLPEKFDSVQIFLGSWCDDSKREVPRLCKIFDLEYFKNIPMSFICLDGNKTVDALDVEEYYVQFVPTIVFYKKGEELCRIIEQPRTESLETDILDLMQRMQ